MSQSIDLHNLPFGWIYGQSPGPTISIGGHVLCIGTASSFDAMQQRVKLSLFQKFASGTYSSSSDCAAIMATLREEWLNLLLDKVPNVPSANLLDVALDCLAHLTLCDWSPQRASPSNPAEAWFARHSAMLQRATLFAIERLVERPLARTPREPMGDALLGDLIIASFQFLSSHAQEEQFRLLPELVKSVTLSELNDCYLDVQLSDPQKLNDLVFSHNNDVIWRQTHLDPLDFSLDTDRHSQLLDPEFSSANGMSLRTGLSALHLLSANTGSPVHKSLDGLVNALAERSHVSKPIAKSIIDAFSIDSTRIVSPASERWNSRDEYRFLRRPLCKVVIDAVPTVVWHPIIVDQSFPNICAGIGNGNLPREWWGDSLGSAKGRLGKEQGESFEAAAATLIGSTGIPIKSHIKKSFGGAGFRKMGDIDVLFYLPWSNQLVVADCKSISGSHDPFTALADHKKFAVVNSEFREQLSERVKWINANMPAVFKGLEIPAPRVQPPLISGFITKYFSLASMIANDVFVMPLSKLIQTLEERGPMNAPDGFVGRREPNTQ